MIGCYLLQMSRLRTPESVSDPTLSLKMSSKRKKFFSFAKTPSFGRSKPAKRKLHVEILENRRVLTALPYGASELDLGEFMLGNVTVTPVFLESNGKLDVSTENWTSTHIQEVLDNIDEGLDWWVDTLATKTSIHELNFTVDTTYAVQPSQTRYEPINRRSNDYTLYVSEFLSSVGYSTGNLELDMRAFNQSQREKNRSDWAFTMIVVPSFNDADGQFAPGGSFSRAFAFAGGLFMVIPSTRPVSTFTHETGHIFWARDEYAGGGSYFQRRGYYNTQNLNAFDNPTSGFVQQPSIMATGELLDTAYAGHFSPDSTLAMIGWQDSDGDGIFDVLDVPHKLTGTGYLDIANSKYHFNGNAHVQTLPNLNPSGLGNDITINRIREIEYRFDGGDWQLLSTPDAYEVDLDLAIHVPSNATEIQIRARDSKTTVESNIFTGRLSRADATQVTGINGFVWVDENKNGLRDIGEFGPEFWMVELVDNSGKLLELRTQIEPDNYPSGRLFNGFSNAVTLTTNGTEGDGRVGVFADSLTSTGNMNFRGYSRSSQSYLSNWNSGSLRLQADFNTPTPIVLIDAIGSSNGTFGRLDAYNSQGKLVGRYTTSELAVGQVETMVISRPTSDIAYVIAGGHANTSIKLDNLRFGPETATTTGALGGYAFPSLPVGNYNVRVTPSTGFVAAQPTGGQQATFVAANATVSDVDFGFVTSTSAWQNPFDANDVNDDGIVSPIDVLLIVNDINQHQARDLRGTNTPFPPYIDVSGDSFVSALDALIVVNFINSQNRGGGEGESAINATESNWGEDALAAREVLFGDEHWPTTSHHKEGTAPSRINSGSDDSAGARSQRTRDRRGATGLDGLDPSQPSTLRKASIDLPF